MKSTGRRKRPKILEKEKLLVWASAAGRCTFCNTNLLANDLLGEAVLIGELAHNVGWQIQSPRGRAKLPDDKRNLSENLLLVCPNCHKPIDDGGVIGRYSVSQLKRRKIEHEKRIRLLTEIGVDRAAFVIRMVGMIRSSAPELSRETVLAATVASGIYPQILPSSHWQDIEIDLRDYGDLKSTSDFKNCVDRIRVTASKINDGVSQNQIRQVAIFAIARIPLLIELGARIDDKIKTVIFQRHRTDSTNAWAWPENQAGPVNFQTRLIRGTKRGKKIVLIVNLSGTIKLSEIPKDFYQHSVYEITPIVPNTPNPNLFHNRETLYFFEQTLRDFLAQVEKDHGKVKKISLFPAIGVAAAVTIGRVLMPNVSPIWDVFDRNEQKAFFKAIEVAA